MTCHSEGAFVATEEALLSRSRTRIIEAYSAVPQLCSCSEYRLVRRGQFELYIVRVTKSHDINPQIPKVLDLPMGNTMLIENLGSLFKDFVTADVKTDMIKSNSIFVKL